MAVFFDFDSTIVSKETLDDAISRALYAHPERERIVREIEKITRLGMEGKLDFTESVRRRLGVVPLTKTHLEETGAGMKDALTPGIEEVFDWLREREHPTYIVSGGFEECVLPVAEHLEILPERVLTNRFTFSPDGVVTGVDESSLLWTSEGKTPALRSLRAQHPDETFIMVGDGMNDYRAYESGAADHFIGFGGHVVRQAVKERAPHFAHSVGALWEFLRSTLP
jgi:HAD superfamily phosphoserine phosphatase-like hydrolase